VLQHVGLTGSGELDTLAAVLTGRRPCISYSCKTR
jgi:hypothetical protein